MIGRSLELVEKLSHDRRGSDALSIHDTTLFDEQANVIKKINRIMVTASYIAVTKTIPNLGLSSILPAHKIE